MALHDFLSAPSKMLTEAIRAVPEVKYALGIGGVIAIIAIVRSGFKLDYQVAVFGAVIMLVLMGMLVIFANLAGEQRTNAEGQNPSIFLLPAVVFTWFALIMVMATAVALFLSVFINWPLNFTRSKPETAIVHDSPPNPLPADARANLDWSATDGFRTAITTALPGQPIEVRVSKRNTGELDALHVVGFHLVGLYNDQKATDAACDDLGERLRTLQNSGISGEITVPSHQDYIVSVKGPVLSPSDVDNIKLGHLSVFVAGTYKYSDEKGHQYNWRFRKIVSGNLGDCGGKQWIGW